jgi:hypothetical protein
VGVHLLVLYLEHSRGARETIKRKEREVRPSLCRALFVSVCQRFPLSYCLCLTMPVPLCLSLSISTYVSYSKCRAIFPPSPLSVINFLLLPLSRHRLAAIQRRISETSGDLRSAISSASSLRDKLSSYVDKIDKVGAKSKVSK